MRLEVHTSWGKYDLPGHKCHSHPVWLPWGRGGCWLHPRTPGSVPLVNSHSGQPQPLIMLRAAKLSLSPCLLKYQLRQGALLPGGFSGVSGLKTLTRHSWEEWGTPGRATLWRPAGLRCSLAVCPRTSGMHLWCGLDLHKVWVVSRWVHSADRNIPAAKIRFC